MPRAAVAAVLPVLLLGALIAAVNPVGYLGGGGDDYQYLHAARCAVEAGGLCTPDTHWAARWPIVLPTAAAIGLFGESRTAIMLAPLVFGLGGLALFTIVLTRQCGRVAGTIGGLALAATPIVGGQTTALNIASVELFFALAALALAQAAVRNGCRRSALAAGAMLGIAIAARATSLALLPLFLVVLAWAAPRRIVVLFALGVGGLLAAEMLVYLAATGDALHGWKLALGHSQLDTSELPASVDRTASPLFNPDFIAAWPRAMGIRVHWTIDGALNLLADPRIALTLLGALAMLLLGRRELGRGGPVGPLPLVLLAAAMLYFGALTYGLAVDPTPRMFLPLAACAAAIIGIFGARYWARGARAGTPALLAAMATVTVVIAYDSFRIGRLEPAASRWASEGAGRMAVDETARRVLTLVPQVRALPPHPAPGMTRLLVIASAACPAMHGGWRLERGRLFAAEDLLRLRGVILGSGESFSLCDYSKARNGRIVA